MSINKIAAGVAMACLASLAGRAQATTLAFDINWGGTLNETFDLDPADGHEDLSGPAIAFFPIFNDSLGADGFYAGDASYSGLVGAGTSTGYQVTSNANYDFFSTPFYNDIGETLQITPGVLYTSQNGLTTLIATVVPEPRNWVLMILGVGMLGGTLRLARQRKLALA
jgi:hypothetical protein